MIGEEPLPTEQSFSQSEKNDRGQWLGKDICELILRGDRLDVNYAWLKVFAEPMILDSDAFGTRSKLGWITGGQKETSLIVFKDSGLMAECGLDLR